MTRRVSPIAVVAISFAALTAGFVAGMRVVPAPEPASLQRAGSAPHAVGPDEYIQLGMQALDQGDARTAEGHFRSAIGLDPARAEAHADLSVALMAQGRWSEAEVAILTAERLAPERYEFLFLEGVLARDGLADTTRARDVWRRFLTAAPPDSPQAGLVREWLEN